jgi:hypothetical protein
MALMANKKLKSLGIVDNRIKNVEWAFQFNDDEPLMIVNYPNGNRQLRITIGDTTNSNLMFFDGKGNSFKIFAREKRKKC